MREGFKKLRGSAKSSDCEEKAELRPWTANTRHVRVPEGRCFGDKKKDSRGTQKERQETLDQSLSARKKINC